MPRGRKKKVTKAAAEPAPEKLRVHGTITFKTWAGEDLGTVLGAMNEALTTLQNVGDAEAKFTTTGVGEA